MLAPNGVHYTGVPLYCKNKANDVPVGVGAPSFYTATTPVTVTWNYCCGMRGAEFTRSGSHNVLFLYFPMGHFSLAKLHCCMGNLQCTELFFKENPLTVQVGKCWGNASQDEAKQEFTHYHHSNGIQHFLQKNKKIIGLVVRLLSSTVIILHCLFYLALLYLRIFWLHKNSFHQGLCRNIRLKLSSFTDDKLHNCTLLLMESMYIVQFLSLGTFNYYRQCTLTCTLVAERSP